MTIDVKGLKINSTIIDRQGRRSIKSQLKQIPCIVFCFPGSHFSSNFLKCWTDTIHYCLQEGIDLLMMSEYSSMVHFARTKCLGADVLRGKNQKPFNNNIPYTHLAWIDSDIVWQPEQIGDLLLRDKDIVSGLYSQTNRENLVAYKICDQEFFKKNGYFQSLTRKEIENESNLIEVEYTGMGFMLIKKGVFESLEYPWFTSQIMNIDNDIQDIASEDATFCKKAKEKGYKIFVDPSVLVGHEKSLIII